MDWLSYERIYMEESRLSIDRQNEKRERKMNKQEKTIEIFQNAPVPKAVISNVVPFTY